MTDTTTEMPTIKLYNFTAESRKFYDTNYHNYFSVGFMGRYTIRQCYRRMRKDGMDPAWARWTIRDLLFAANGEVTFHEE